MAEYRIQRVQSLIREQIGTMIIHGTIKDPRVSPLLSVSGVKVSKDLGHAVVYISGIQDEQKLERAVKALNHAAGFIQGNIGKAIRLRSTPKLKFVNDSSIRKGDRITKIIEELSG
jgi:ribosome-binding factor A